MSSSSSDCLIKVKVGGGNFCAEENYGLVSFNQIEATLKKVYPLLNTIKIVAVDERKRCHPGDGDLPGGGYEVEITVEERGIFSSLLFFSFLDLIESP